MRRLSFKSIGPSSTAHKKTDYPFRKGTQNSAVDLDADDVFPVHHTNLFFPVINRISINRFPSKYLLTITVSDTHFTTLLRVCGSISSSWYLVFFQ